MSILLPYQEPGAAQLVRALTHGQKEWGYPGAADLSDAGTGKSVMDLHAMLQIGRKPIVLCPRAGEEGWRKTFSLFNAEPHYLGSYEGLKMGGRMSIATRHQDDTFTWHNAGEIGLICDEAQAVKSAESLAFRCIEGAIQANVPMICASATLAASPIELPIAGRITGLHKGGDDWIRFLVEHGCEFDDVEKRWVWKRKRYMLEQIHHILIPERGNRTTRAMMGDRPGSSISMLPIECEEGPRIIEEWERGNTQLRRMEAQKYPKMIIIATRRKIRMRLWQECEAALVPHIAGRIREDVDNFKSVVAFLGFVKTRERLGKLLNTRAGLYGGQNQKQRAFYEHEFQADRIRILLNQIKAGGAAVSLHDVRGEFPRVGYIFPSDSGVAMGQAPWRLDRQGSKSRAEIWIPTVKGTLTEQMVKSTERKLRAMAGLNDGGVNN
jgi:hypothetical protein